MNLPCLTEGSPAYPGGRRPLNTSPRMQAFVWLLCKRQGVDLAQAVAGDYLRLENPTGDAHLIISVLADGQLAVGYTLWYDNRMVMDLEMKFLVTPDGWEPVSVQDCFSRSWDEYWTEAGREGIAVFAETGTLNLPSMTEYWADRLTTWGWLRKGLLEEGTLAMLANSTQPFPTATQKAAPKAPAAPTSPTPITATLTQASLF